MKYLNYKIRYIKKENVQECISIANLVLGNNYIHHNQFLSIINDNKFICLKASIKNQVIGFCVGCIMNYKDALGFLKIANDNFLSGFEHNDQIAIIKTIAIKEEYQHKGIGNLFVEKLEQIFSSKADHLVLCVVWRYDNIENAGPLLQKNGYKSGCVIENYWQEESISEGFSCPVCGDTGCRCSANIYIKNI